MDLGEDLPIVLRALGAGFRLTLVLGNFHQRHDSYLPRPICAFPESESAKRERSALDPVLGSARHGDRRAQVANLLDRGHALAPVPRRMRALGSSESLGSSNEFKARSGWCLTTRPMGDSSL
jgi:hypothetical protein